MTTALYVDEVRLLVCHDVLSEVVAIPLTAPPCGGLQLL